ncbi:hypothetical protein CASFOL_036900 [Castilleja foliolosa]|uniref:Scarecrow-like protein 28 n=1 Tax=Castilleja foliolosa TaxID=1961234 RepID=A0ABD3BRJ9_9LAMI
MLAGCSSSLLSPRHRLRNEPSTQFQACHIPPMSTQRLDLPCSSFARKDGRRSQPVRPVVGLSIEKPIIEAKTSGCSLRQNIKLPPTPTEARRDKNKDVLWEQSSKKSAKKREASYDEESYTNRAKRKRADQEVSNSLGQLGSVDSFWFHPGPPQVSPLPPLSNIPWFDSVHCPEITASGGSSSSTSDESHRSLILGLGGGNQAGPEAFNSGDSPSPHNPTKRAEIDVPAQHNGENNNWTEHECAELVSLLVACAEQIVSRNITATNHCLSRLGEIASPRGSPVHRLVAYFTEALSLRAARMWPHIFHITAPRELDRADEDSGLPMRLLNQVSPIPKFIHFTSNEILLRAFEGKDRVHIIDFDVKNGLQWPSLFQSLASRTNPPSHIRITGIGESKQELIETGDRLSGFAEALNLNFEFHPVVDRLEDVRLWMLHVKEREAVAVNCVFQLHKLLYDSSGRTIRDFLRLIQSTKPETVVMAEQEGAHNEVGLDARLCNSLRYYSAVFDAVDSSGLALESPVRAKIEEMFGCEIRNIIACEGRERLERHQIFDRWREVMEGAGFQGMGIDERELFQGRMLLRMYGSEEYRVERSGPESVMLSWLDQPLYTVSGWRSVDDVVAGSSYSQPS